MPLWIKAIFSALWKSFKEFMKQVFTQSLEIALAALKDIAIQAVKEVDNFTTFTDQQKREMAFDKIKKYAVEKGLSVKDSIINLAIELAIQYLKNTK
jgi:uncharacterized alkaline shock family protein YloU